MAEIGREEYKFPDEQDEGKPVDTEQELEIEIEDDIPEPDRGRTPPDADKVRQLEVDVDDLDKYSKEAKDKLIRMKRVWNDERRAKETADRERAVAVDAAQRLMTENRRIKEMLNSGQEEYKAAITSTTQMQLEKAKRDYKDAYDSGDTDKVIEAQQALTEAQMLLERARNFKMPPLQDEENVVQRSQQYQDVPPQPVNDRLTDWQERNSWFGQDEEMTAAALGLHEKLKRQGTQIGSEEYYATLDTTMRKRFPENFDDDRDPLEEVKEKPRGDSPKARPATVVASATRSTAPKRVRLTTSQVAIAKKLGLTPEQYVRELLKLEV